MKRKSFFLALDIGTSSTKAGLFDLDFNLVRTDKVDYAFDTRGMAVDIDPEKIWQAFLTVVRRLGPDARRVEWVVQCVLSPSLIPMDEDGNALYPSILHWDRRSAVEARKALALIGKERFLRRAGNIPYPGGISLTSLLWVRDHEPEVFRKAFRFGHMNTFFLRRLTGRWAIDPTNASLIGLYDTVGRSGWLEDFCRETGVPVEKLPPVVECLEWLGKVTSEAARASGLRAGTPVIMGSNDTSSACLGAGVLDAGQILNITGSAELLAICLDRPVANEKYHLRAHPLPGRWIVFNITTSGFTLEWFRTQFCREMDEKTFYQSYLGSLLKEDRRTTVRFTPHLAGDRTSLLQKKGAFSGLTLATTRDDCVYAIMDGLSSQTWTNLRRMGRVVKLDTVIHLAGGGANPVLMAYKRRRFPGFTFEVREECALLGCAFMSKEMVSRKSKTKDRTKIGQG